MPSAAPHHYTFHSTWRDLPAPRARVVATLADVGRYAQWWSAVRVSTPLADGRGRIELRSVLPFTLRFSLERLVEDRAAGILRARATGDIEGTIEWSVREAGGGSVADFTQAVELRHRPGRVVDRWVRPALEWNHAAAMRSGRRDLVAHLRAR